MTAGGAVLRVPRPADRRREWLEAVLERFADPAAPQRDRATLRLAEVMAKYAGHDGVCRAPRRVLMHEAGVPKAYVVQAAQRDMEEAGLLLRMNPGAPPRLGAEYALVLEGTLIRGGDVEDAPRFGGGVGYQVVHAKHGRAKGQYGWLQLHRAPEVEDDLEDDWMDEPRPHCQHTLRTCSPECSEWGGR